MLLVSVKKCLSWKWCELVVLRSLGTTAAKAVCEGGRDDQLLESRIQQVGVEWLDMPIDAAAHQATCLMHF
jgi:hypothetical protein